MFGFIRIIRTQILLFNRLWHLLLSTNKKSWICKKCAFLKWSRAGPTPSCISNTKRNEPSAEISSDYHLSAINHLGPWHYLLLHRLPLVPMVMSRWRLTGSASIHWPMPNVNIDVITTYAFIVAHPDTLSALTRQKGAGKHNIMQMWLISPDNRKTTMSASSRGRATGNPRSPILSWLQ